MRKAEERSKEIMQAALDYANNLEDVKPTDEFSRNLCISLGQAFIKGAEFADSHQAEKDMDISWVKEVSGVKEMKRAEEEALKAYPPISIAANYDTISRRDAFEFGYLKAEKDLELTWEDLKTLDDISDDVYAECDVEMLDMKEYYQEVLKRFKNMKDGSKR